MKLDRVTITGADNNTNPADLVALARAYPFAEFGILVSLTHANEPRWPGGAWMGRLEREIAIDGRPLNLSLHVCGHWVRELLLGRNIIPPWMLEGYQRIQLNFHAENTPCKPVEFAAALRSLGDRQIIFQIDGANGNKHLESVWSTTDVGAELDCVSLFDISGGVGILPRTWPKPMYYVPSAGPRDTYAYHGYAGGLGPDNLAEQLPRIAEAAGDCRIWIDMESRVRSYGRYPPGTGTEAHGGDFLDLAKVERCLEIAEPYIKGE